MQPVFIISLPRSGSTLLQRCLSVDPSVASAPESWTFLHLLPFTRDNLEYSIFNSRVRNTAYRDFLSEQLGNDHPDLDALGRLALVQFAQHAGERAHFLEKTPRNYLFVPELAQMFPQGKFIILQRNPLDIAASMINTWGEGKWNLWKYYVDLYLGAECLARARDVLGDRGLSVTYEELVGQPERTWQALSTYLGLASKPNLLVQGAGARLEGKVGDRKGDSLSSLRAPREDEWKTTFDNPFRRRWAREYARDVLATCYRDYDAHPALPRFTLADLSKISQTLSDLLRAALGVLDCRLDLHLWRTRGISCLGKKRYFRLD